ncbi:DUF512 domain-containing protein [Papillibacter cinnamivorans]|uniref:DUF512 domain-containing protein n=1 Tax=Papillibacter cinnamivorans TaxID=100176 RepID=UPI001FA8F318|nr:DUF512 domain-containing protein [Papillibacter cinnamivorans]
MKKVAHGSPAHCSGVRPGERLLSVNGHRIADVLDYRFYAYDPRLELELEDGEGRVRRVRLRKSEGADPGLEFETYLMDKARSCANKCVFCFVDQLPPGMRETLYFKDDDARLSFLMGNYITLTNLSSRELKRIIDLRISPINVSVHAANPELRASMLGNPRGAEGMERMRALAAAGIVMNCQIVLCPGLNDREELSRTMEELAALYPEVASVSVVPVGLTKHREGLYPLRPFGREEAAEAVRQVDLFGEACLSRFGSRVFFCADELYLKANLSLPPEEYYEDYPQLENGVGMLRLLEAEFLAALEEIPPSAVCRPCSVATGVAAAPFLKRLVDLAAGSCHTVDCRILPVVNRFFGETIDVAGLVTGGDLISQLSGRDLGGRLLIPAVMLRHGGDVFLDDVTPEEASSALGVPVLSVQTDGGALAKALFEI